MARRSLERLALAAQSGDFGAEAEFVSRMWVVARIEARQFHIGGTSHEDRWSVALAAVVSACRTYDESRAASVVSYTKICVRHALIEMARREGPKRLARRLEAQAYRLKDDEDTDGLSPSLAVDPEPAPRLGELVAAVPARVVLDALEDDPGVAAALSSRLAASGALASDEPPSLAVLASRLAALCVVWSELASSGRQHRIRLERPLLRAVRSVLAVAVKGLA